MLIQVYDLGVFVLQIYNRTGKKEAAAEALAACMMIFKLNLTFDIWHSSSPVYHALFFQLYCLH